MEVTALIRSLGGRNGHRSIRSWVDLFCYSCWPTLVEQFQCHSSLGNCCGEGNNAARQNFPGNNVAPEENIAARELEQEKLLPCPKRNTGIESDATADW